MSHTERRAIIARLNDKLRQTGEDGWIFLTVGIAYLPISTKNAIVNAIRLFDAFTPDNDPYGEHDCAILTVKGRRILWKIDYYRRDHTNAECDPADAATTKCVLTIMLAEEY